MRISDWSSDVCSSDLLDRLLPEIVIDPEDLGFVQDREDRPVQGPCRSEIRTERLLHDHPAPSVGVVAHQTCGAELTDHRCEDLRRRCKIEQIGRASCRERVCLYV